METRDELKEMLVNNAASCGNKEGDEMAEIYVDDFINELLGKFNLLPIPVVISRRELLFAFEEYWNKNNCDGESFPAVVDRFLANNSC